MSTTDIDTIRETNDRIFNRGDLDYVDETYAEDVVVHNVAQGEDYEGRDAFKEWVKSLRETYPDFETEIEDVVLGDGKFATQYVVRGTQEGPLPGFDIEPTNQRIEIRGATVHEMDGDLVSEAWWYYDLVGLLEQLGLVPESLTA